MQYRQRAAIALGSNLGDSCQILNAACEHLKEHAQVCQVRCSSFYRTPPIGPPQPDYINACAVLETELQAMALLEWLLEIEQTFGRQRLERWGPRTLDLDLLLYGEAVIDQPRLQVPHPRMVERGFVLLPLSEVASDWIHPITNCSILELRNQVDCSEISML